MPDIKRTWSVPTSPRSPYKLPQELNLLKEFEGQIWNVDTQRKFARKLAESDFYEGIVSETFPDFSARDRVNRSPKTFGFVEFKKRRVCITEAGKKLIEGLGVEELFTRQLLKWQYPSPNHHGDRYQDFNIRPFVEMLRLIYELDGLSKREIAIFGLPFINLRNYALVKEEIMRFRGESGRLRNVERKRFIVTTHTNKYRSIYRAELLSGSFRVRESRGRVPDEARFIATKVRNSMDYADASIRYFRATGLFKLSATTFRIQIIESKLYLVKEILSTISRNPLSFEDKEGFLNYYGNPNLPTLPDDRPEVLQTEISKLVQEIFLKTLLPKNQLDAYRHERLVSASVPQLKESRSRLEKILTNDARKIQLSAIQSYSQYDDIIRMYEKVVNRADYDIPDKPLFFEWNTWRAFAMLDDGEIICNAVLDMEGKPLSTAPGGVPDSVGRYQNFILTIEVTLTRGERQFEAENESVPRHLGKIVKLMRESGDERPVFGFFIASGLNISTVAHFYALRRSNVLHYGGKAKIIPLDLSAFKHMLVVAKDAGGIKAVQLLSFLKWADEEADRVRNEEEWYFSIERKIQEWTKC